MWFTLLRMIAPMNKNTIYWSVFGFLSCTEHILSDVNQHKRNRIQQNQLRTAANEHNLKTPLFNTTEKLFEIKCSPNFSSFSTNLPSQNSQQNKPVLLNEQNSFTTLWLTKFEMIRWSLILRLNQPTKMSLTEIKFDCSLASEKKLTLFYDRLHFNGG